MPIAEVVKDEAYYMSLDKRSKEYKDWKAAQEQNSKVEEVKNKEVEESVQEPVEDSVNDASTDASVSCTVENISSTLVVNEPMMKIKRDGNIETAPSGEFNVTYHRYKMNDKVYAVMFGLIKESRGYQQIKNNAKFYVHAGEIEKVIITDIVQYKLKNIAGSLLNEDMIYFDKDAAQVRADAENGGLHARGEGR